jgi:hypothetical protein
MLLGRYLFLLFSFIAILFFSGCVNTPAEIETDAPYQDYKIWGEEGKDVTCLFQFLYGRHNGKTLSLTDGANIRLDNKIIAGDSAKITGAYYEVRKPIDSFVGRHQIVFTSPSKKIYREDFDFKPFYLTEKIPSHVSRGDLIIRVEGLNQSDSLRVVATDTAFHSNGINEPVAVKNGLLIITRALMSNIVDGPITLQLYKETEKPLKKGAHGRIAVTYGLQRQFLLEE